MTVDPTPRKPRAPRLKPPAELTPVTAAAVAGYLARSVPEKHRLATERALRGQVPRSVAIRIKCLQCCNYEREEVVGCAVVTCALHPVRPYQPRSKSA